jgi:membrane peptidoglycan carboxypeptidase
MQTSLARRQRQRRRSQRRPRGHGAARAVAVTIPLVLFGILLLLGAAGAVASVAAYNYLAQDLEDPQQALDAITFTSQSAVYDRTGEVLLAKLGDDRRTVVKFDQIPPGLVDATTSIEDKTFWENSGFDPLGFVSAAIDTINGNDRGASTITQQLVRARLLPQSAFDEGVYIRKAKEIIQSIRLTEAYPGVEGKQAIMEKYLNQNFYGNRSYGVAAAAKSYWGKNLQDLTLAQMALLAAIPQSPTRYDLVKNAVEETYTDDKGKEQTHLVVPLNTEVVQRRNYILDLMKTRSVLTAKPYTYQGTTYPAYTTADFEAAKAEPVILGSQAADSWRAPQFVLQARSELGTILCGDPVGCDKIDTGGYKVITTLDYRAQRIVEKWVYAAARIPNSKNPNKLLKNRGIPRKEWGWIKGLIGGRVHNAAAGVVDYRTGEIRAYVGSADYNGKPTKKFQPQFDVLGDGWRQPGSSIKPLVYSIGIEDRTLTAATMFMDVVTNFASSGQKAYYPTQADGLERGPVRLRQALQFSLNIPAVKAGILIGLDREFNGFQDFGLSFPSGTGPVVSQSIGTLGTHPIEMISAFGAIANGGVLMPRHTILKILDRQGNQVWPLANTKVAGQRVISRQTAYIVTDILAGNTNTSVNPFWAKWRVTDGVTSSKVRQAAYKTGTTQDNRDVLADGFLPMPADKSLPALVVGVWMGNSDNTPNNGRLSLDASAPLWSAIMSDVAKGMPIDHFARTKPKGIATAKVDAFTGMKPGPGTRKTVTEMFLPGTEPTKSSVSTITLDVDAATGKLWQDGCAGPMETRTFIDLSSVDAANKTWQKADIAWQARAARGAGVYGGPKHTGTSYFYGGGFYPFGRSWGGSFAPTKTCPIAPPSPSVCVSVDPLSPCPSEPALTPEPTVVPGPGGQGKPSPKPTPAN